MPDISMCSNYNCPLRRNCYRYLAVPSDYGFQTYSDFNPEGHSCEAFWDAEGRHTDPFLIAEQRNIKLYDGWYKNTRSKK